MWYTQSISSNWKEVMEDEYATKLQNLTHKKEHDKERKLQAQQCLDKLEQGDKALCEVALESLDHIGRQKLQKLSHDVKMM